MKYLSENQDQGLRMEVKILKIQALELEFSGGWVLGKI